MTGIVDTVDVSIEVFGGLDTDLAPSDLPHGVSPDCQDLQFTIGSVKTRPGITAAYTLPPTALLQLASDNFTRANEAPLNPANWTNFQVGLGLAVLANVCVGRELAGDSELYTGIGFSSDQYASATIQAFGTNSEVTVYTRQSVPSGPGGYQAFVIGNSITNTYNIFLYGGVTGGVMGSFALGHVPNPGDILTLTSRGQTHTVFYNGTPIISVLDSTYTMGATGLGIKFSAAQADTTVSLFSTGTTPAIDVNYLKTYYNLQEVPRLLSLDSSGQLRRDSTPGGALTTIFNDIIAGAFCRSDSLFGNEYMAFGNGTEGLDMPRQYNDTYFDRVSQVGPGAPPSVADSGAAGNIVAGLHMMTVIFVTRSGYYTRPAPPTSWTAAGNKQAAVTNIPIGPPNVVARVLSFTASALDSFYHLGPLGLTLANSNMYIADNVTTTLTVDFTDQILLLGTLDDPLFNMIELPPVSGTIGYSSRLFHWGEQANIQNMLNLTFDGGFAGAAANANTGALSPTAASGAGVWVGRTNADVPWGTPLGPVATCAIGASGVSRQLIQTGYGAAVPMNARVTGVVAVAPVKGSAGGTVYDAAGSSGAGVFLTLDGVTIGSSNHANGNLWTAAFAAQTYGSAADSWGVAGGLTPAIVNSPNFGIIYAAEENAGGQTASVEPVTLTIYYATPAAGAVPLGWTAGANFAGGASANAGPYPVVFGDAFSITGDGATAIRGQITQGAAINYLNNPIIVPGVSYGVQARVASTGALNAGTLHVNLQSTVGGFTTPGLAVQAMQTGAAYALFIGVLTTALVGQIPADLLLQVYADGTPNNGGVLLIDNIEIYPLNEQWNNSNVRASFAQLNTQGQESYDSVTGLIQYNLNDGQSVRNAFKIRERLYIVKEHSFGVTEDTGTTEPSFWTVNDVSTKVGTPSVNGVGVGEDWVVIAHRTGLYLFWGGEVLTISQEIQPTWDTINWQYGSTISVSVDIRKRRIFVCAPFGNSTIPNKTLVMDYHDVGSDASAIASNPPIHLTYTGTKKAFDRSRKWCPWTVSANSVAQIENTNGQAYTYFGSNDGTGDINALDDTNTIFTDNGNTIPSYYTTAAFAELPTEDAKQLKSHRHLYTYLTMYVLGSGTIGLTLFPDSLSNAIAINSIALSNPAFVDAEMMLNQSTERLFVKVASQGSGQFFDLQRCVINMKPEPWTIVRGAP